MPNKDIGKTLKKARKSLGLLQSEVAEKAGISSNYYSMLEQGNKTNPSREVLIALAKVLKLKSSDLFSF